MQPRIKDIFYIIDFQNINFQILIPVVLCLTYQHQLSNIKTSYSVYLFIYFTILLCGFLTGLILFILIERACAGSAACEYTLEPVFFLLGMTVRYYIKYSYKACVSRLYTCTSLPYYSVYAW